MMLRAMMVTAFRAYLRVGEMAPRSKNRLQGCLLIGDVVIAGDILLYCSDILSIIIGKVPNGCR